MERAWLGPLSAVDAKPPRVEGRSVAATAGTAPPIMAVRLCVMTAEAHSGGSATRWRGTGSVEHRFHISQLGKEAGEQLVELRGVHSGTPRGGPHPCSSTSVRVPP